MPSKFDLMRQQELPKPKLYSNEKQTRVSRTRMNETIEDGQIVEEIESSDEDDCISLKVHIDDE